MLRWCFGLGLAIAFVLLTGPFGAAGAVGAGKSCGGVAGIACDAGLWCDPRPGMCHAANASGTCVQEGAFCAMIYQPVCGCDGKTYGNDCERMHAKAAKAHDGACQ